MRRSLVLLLLAPACVPRLYTEGGAGNWEWIPPENSWESTPPPEGTVGTGYTPGQVVPDFRLVDQFGDEVSLWQFYGNVVLLDISTIWCRPCQDLASHTQETAEAYAEEGFVYVTVLQEDIEANPPDLDDLNLWADQFGIASPILGDTEKVTLDAIENGIYPAVLVIGRDLKVAQRVSPPEDSEVRRAIENAL